MEPSQTGAVGYGGPYHTIFSMRGLRPRLSGATMGATRQNIGQAFDFLIHEGHEGHEDAVLEANVAAAADTFPLSSCASWIPSAGQTRRVLGVEGKRLCWRTVRYGICSRGRAPSRSSA